MNWSDQIIKVIDALCQKFGVAIDWTQQNVLPYFQQLASKIVIYKLCLACLGCGTSLLFMVATGIYLARANKKNKLFAWETLYRDRGRFENGNARAVIAIILIAVCACAMVPVFLANIVAIIKCLTVPELVVFEYIKKLADGVTG